jgi:hypothetical protein
VGHLAQRFLVGKEILFVSDDDGYAASGRKSLLKPVHKRHATGRKAGEHDRGGVKANADENANRGRGPD